MRRLLTISAALSAAIAPLATGMLVRGFFVSDGWNSPFYTPAARTLDVRSIYPVDGWLLFVRQTAQMPQWYEPQSRPSVVGTWVHEPEPPKPLKSFPPRTYA